MYHFSDIDNPGGAPAFRHRSHKLEGYHPLDIDNAACLPYRWNAMTGRRRAKRGNAGRRTARSAAYSYTAVFEPAVEGGYTVTVPMLPGVITEGDTLAEARARVKEAVQGYLIVLRKRGEPIPRERGTKLRRPIAERVAVTV